MANDQAVYGLAEAVQELGRKNERALFSLVSAVEQNGKTNDKQLNRLAEWAAEPSKQYVEVETDLDGKALIEAIQGVRSEVHDLVNLLAELLREYRSSR